MNLKTPIILALDVDDFSKGLELARKLKSGLGAIKVGPRLLIQRGAEVVAACSEIAPVFVDNKYYDIPSTMESAVRMTFEAGATFVTVHALAGPEALEKLAKLEREFSQKRPVKILAVTMLTSYKAETLPAPLQGKSIPTLVADLAAQAIQSGLSGLVCSPHEAADLRKKFPKSYLVTPGVRMGTEKKDDQSRTMTPKEAIQAGANALVIGRPLLEANKPEQFIQEILGSL